MRPFPRPLPPSGLSPAEAAAAWFVRSEGGALTPAENQAFEAWLGETERNRALYEQAASAWAVFDGADADPHIRSLRSAALQDEPERRHPWWVAVAASLALAVTTLLGFHFLSTNGKPAATQIAAATSYHTGRGQRLEFALSDGTSVVLNTDSVLDVHYSAAQRLVRLERGQAFFEVAKNKARPFVVVAGPKRVIAVGTAFDVRVDPQRMRVLLVEGKVAVESHARDPHATKFLIPGQQLTTDAAGDTLSLADQNALLWREGLIEFDDVPLGVAVGEMNRYAPRPIVVADRRVADLRISGMFKLNQTDRFPQLVGEILPTEARQTGVGTEIVLRAAR